MSLLWAEIIHNHYLHHLVAFLPIFTTEWASDNGDEEVGSVSSKEPPELVPVDFDPVRNGDDWRPDGPDGRAVRNAPTGPSNHSTDSTAA